MVGGVDHVEEETHHLEAGRNFYSLCILYLMNDKESILSSGEILYIPVLSMADTVHFLLSSTFCFETPLTAATVLSHIAYFAFHSDIFDKFVLEFCDMSE